MTYGGDAAVRVWDQWGSDASAFSHGAVRWQYVTSTSSASTFDVSQATTPSWLPTAKKTLEQLRALRGNWDSYGSAPISPAMTDAAYNLLRQIVPANVPMPSIVPTSDGSVQFEWHTRGIDLEVRVLSTARIGVSFDDTTLATPGWDTELKFDVTPLKALMLQLAARGP